MSNINGGFVRTGACTAAGVQQGFSVRSVGPGKLFVSDFPIQPGFIQSPYKTGDFQIPITLSKLQYDTRSMVHFEALEQTVRLRLVSGPVDK
jgi:hypothetical protein